MVSDHDKISSRGIHKEEKAYLLFKLTKLKNKGWKLSSTGRKENKITKIEWLKY